MTHHREADRNSKPPLVVTAFDTSHPLLVCHVPVNKLQGPWALTHGPAGGIIMGKLKSRAHARLLAAELQRNMNIEEVRNMGDNPTRAHKRTVDACTKRVLNRMRGRRDRPSDYVKGDGRKK